MFGVLQELSFLLGINGLSHLLMIFLTLFGFIYLKKKGRCDVGVNLLPSMAYGSWFVEVCLVKCYDDMLISIRHAKCVAYLHINMATVDIYKRKLILKMGYFMMVMSLCI